MANETKKVAFHTLGCKLNYAETSMLSRQFESAGYIKTDFHGPADLYVINTCSVTENADKEFRKLVNRAKRSSPGSKIAVIGCYAQLRPEEIVQQGHIDLVLGAKEKFNLLKHIDFSKDVSEPLIIRDADTDALHGCVPSYSMGDRTRSFLKIQDGCDYPCTYCTIPLARGKSRSLSIASLVEQTHEIVDQGIKEIVLTGVNVGDFRGEGEASLLALLRALEINTDIQRVRISSIEPNLLTDEIIEWVAGSRVVLPHFHIPLQSGSDTILRAMKRRYVSDLYIDRVRKVRELLPDAGIGADVIVGFPGEGDVEFQETYDLIKSLDVSYLHVFTYSERPDTAALALPGKVPMQVRKKRNRILTELSEDKHRSFTLRQLDSVHHVLVESLRGKHYSGMTDNYLKVEFEAGGVDKLNTIQPIRLSALDQGRLMGKIQTT